MPVAITSLWELIKPWSGWIAMIWLVYAVYLAGWLILQKRSPISTLTWVVTLVLMPLLGLVIYRYFGPLRVVRQSLRRSRSHETFITREDVRTLLAQRSPAPDEAQAHSRLIERSCGLPMASCHRADFLKDGAATLAALVEAIDGAREQVHLEYYIFEPDHSGLQVLEALTRKASEGVTVRLIIDGVGSSRLLKWRNRHLLRALTRAGGQWAVFHPTRFARMRPMVNLRTHRKIAVIDRTLGFTGGINVTDDENDALHPDTAYRDTHLRMEGQVVNWLQYLFVQDWVYVTEQPLDTGGLFETAEPGPIAAQLVASGPDTRGHAIHRAMIDAIANADERVWLATPYFVPTEAALTALSNASLRGVDVRLMVPRVSDSKIVTAAARSYFDELRATGVRIFEYGPRMLHAKTMVVDSDMAVIGTANFDYRSFYLNFELNVVLFNAQSAADLARMFEDDCRRSNEVGDGDHAPGFFARLGEAGARLGSPLL